MSGLFKGAGYVAQATSQMQQAEINAAQAKVTGQGYQASAVLAEQEAEAIGKSGAYEEAKLLREKKQILGKQRAAYAKSGVRFDEGSPLEVMADSATGYEMDISAKRYNVATTVAQKEYKATYYKSLSGYYQNILAPAYRRAGRYGATATLLTGAGDIFSDMEKTASGGVG